MQTRNAIATHGHLMTYRVIPPTFPGGEERLSQWDAQHSPDCACHGSDDPEPLPDW